MINEGSTFLLTGGYYTKRLASRYDATGWIEDLDPLLSDHYLHGCTQYENSDGSKVLSLSWCLSMMI